MRRTSAKAEIRDARRERGWAGGADSILRAHVIVLPTVAVLVIAVHLWRVRKDGGLRARTSRETQ